MTTQLSSSLISSICKSREIVLNQMDKLGFDTTDYKNFSINEVNAMLQNSQLDMLLEKNTPDDKTKRKNKVYIKYYLGKTISQKNIQEMIDDLFYLEEGNESMTKDDTLYIIIKYEINETLTNLIKHIWESQGIFIIIQNIKRLQFNILEHVLVPPHRLLNDDEVHNIKNKYNITENTQFPDISRFDPVAQVICLRPGQVCEIERPSKTSIMAYYYRICV
jgi:DNA-directed RNA polymerase subunit H